jgi:parallel beta-helix repeat protein
MLSAVMLTLLLANMLTLASNIQPVVATGTIYVRADGSIDPPDAPISTVDNVTYTLTGNITSDVHGIVVERSNIIVDGAGYTVQGTGSGTGIDLTGRSNVTIKNTEITTFFYGIRLVYSSNNTISGNNIANNDYGIYFDEGTSHNSIIWNVFVNDGLYVWGSTDGNVVVDNSVNGKPLVYLEDVSDIVVEDAGQVILVDCTRIRVENLSLSNTVVGVYLCRTNYTFVVGNHITNNSDDGIWLYESSNNSITGNDVTSNGGEGIYLFSSSDNTIGNNTLMSNRVYGISVGGASVIQLSSNNIIINNTVTDNECGFQFWGGGEYYNTVMNNRVNSNGAGIELGDNARYNTFVGNAISNNDYGIYLHLSSDNKFYHNNLINNSVQVYSGSSTNVWDDGYPSGGNYWSDYTGVDLKNGFYQNETGSDGVGDIAYSIGAANQDNYPLVGIFSAYDVTYYTPPFVSHACNVAVISNSTISDFVAPLWIEHPEVIFLQFNVSGAEGSTGFCRVSFPTAMMNGTCHVSVNGAEIPYTLLPCSDANYSYLYFNYTHSTQEVIIIPEFPSFLILPLFFIATLLAAIIYRRKHPQNE